MDLHYSMKDLDNLKAQAERSKKALEENGTILSGEHQLLIILKLIEESRQLREELVSRYSTDESY